MPLKNWTRPVTRRATHRPPPAATTQPPLELRCPGTWPRIRGMFRSLPQATALTLVLTLAAPVGAVVARAAAEGRVSLDEAIRKVRSRYGDVTILKARTKKRNGSQVHTIKFLTDSGRV